MAVISAHTHERSEGYFRLEWKLAVERTHLMREGVPFLVPVVIDDAPEDAAMVPEPFMRVQWTRLAGALPTAQFVEQACGPSYDKSRRRISLRFAPPQSPDYVSRQLTTARRGLWFSVVDRELA